MLWWFAAAADMVFLSVNTPTKARSSARQVAACGADAVVVPAGKGLDPGS